MRLLVVLTAALSVSAACTNPVVRKEWSQLTDAEKTQYVNAVMALTKRPTTGNLQDPNAISYYDFVETHTRNAFWAHGNAQFYPFHRAMMWQWDRALSTVGWNQGSVYWDWPSMSQNWWTSDIFSSKYFGAVLSNDPDNCVIDGAFAKGKFKVSSDATSTRQRQNVVGGGDPTCLRRCGHSGTAVTDATSLTEPILTATTYTAFRGDDTSNYHAVGHETIGGGACDFGNPSYSPNDPLFYLHHGLVDKTWWRWQQACPSYKTDYEGFLARADDPMGDGKDNIAYATLNLDSWSWWTVADMLDTQGDVLCYTYSKSAGDLPIPTPADCKPVVASPTPSSTSKNAMPSSGSSAESDATTTATTTKAPGPTSSAKNTTSNPDGVVDGWLNIILQDLVEVPSFVFKVPGVSEKKQRRDSATAAACTAGYIEIQEPDNSTCVMYCADSHEICVPPGYSINLVYESNVQAINIATNHPQMFFEALDPVSYVKPPCAPDNVAPGEHHCYLSKPNRVSLGYASSMKMNLAQVSNNDNIVAMQIDMFNCECDKNFSPSQMKYWSNETVTLP
ncbi:hypothetical protein BC830DRAFT_1121494 [Chytriomyces sp. MP71]|nr:hypothetical protein BC830DRAFT_1121494 [Chytriomyces sp. MP71]